MVGGGPDPEGVLGLSAGEVLEAIGCAVLVLDGDGVVVAVNEAARAMEDLIGGVGDTYLRRPAGEQPVDLVLADGIGRVLDRRSPRFEIEHRVDGPDGVRWLLLLAGPVGSGQGAVVTLVDVTSQHDVREILDDTARRDPLTGLPNRRGVVATLGRAIRQGGCEGTDLAVAFLDLNGFKAVNDELGHDAGDDVLAAVGRRLAGAVRSGDLLGRWGGDEFVVVVQEPDGERGITALAERLHGALEQPVALRGRSTVSLGVAIGATLVRPGDRPDEVLARADAAMYEAKRTGRRLVLAPRDPRGVHG